MNSFTTFLFALMAALFALVAAAPVAVRDVFDPTILYPHAGTVWVIGQHHNVTWETSNAPKQITNSEGVVVLAKGGIEVTGRGSFNNPLASNFSILLGRIEVQVPDVTPGDDYQIVLFGDSGNFGPTFTITN